MRESCLSKTPLKQIQFRDPGNFKPLGEMYLGVKEGIELRSHQYDRQDVNNFRKSCLEFLIEAALQIYKRFSFESEHLESLKA